MQDPSQTPPQHACAREVPLTSKSQQVQCHLILGPWIQPLCFLLRGSGPDQQFSDLRCFDINIQHHTARCGGRSLYNKSYIKKPPCVAVGAVSCSTKQSPQSPQPWRSTPQASRVTVPFSSGITSEFEVLTGCQGRAVCKDVMCWDIFCNIGCGGWPWVALLLLECGPDVRGPCVGGCMIRQHESRRQN